MAEKIAIVSGGFDPIHVGHLEMMQKAAELGRLIVILNSDEWLTRKKGKYFMTYDHRKKIIEEFKCVSEVVPVDDSDGSVCEALRRLYKEHCKHGELIFANGGDRTEEEGIPEVAVCKSLNIKLVWNLGKKIESSSELVSRWEQNKKPKGTDTSDE
jgi:D-beta-D-heptose 7-phosphate kinase/D-beta-D-heptose 1-phosphate adenosyltransferase